MIRKLHSIFSSTDNSTAGNESLPDPIAPGKDAPAAPDAQQQSKPGNRHEPTPKKLRNAPLSTPNYQADVPVIPAYSPEKKTLISFVVIIYDMPDQAEQTLYSLSTAYQRSVSEADYEVIVMENSSPNNLGEERATRFGGNFRYFYREETQPSPVPSINFGASQAHGSHISVMIDGARMLSPGVVSYMLAACRLGDNAITAVPGYHLGYKTQQEAMLQGYTREVEHELLESVNWKQDGYRLFEVCCFSGTSSGGFFRPFGESNCFCVPRHLWDELGGYDPAFTETGGGQVNLDFFKRAVEHPDTLLVILPGEGNFHQFHGGITTGTKGAKRLKAMQDHFNQYASIRGGPYQPPAKRPIYLGSIPDAVAPFLDRSASLFLATTLQTKP